MRVLGPQVAKNVLVCVLLGGEEGCAGVRRNKGALAMSLSSAELQSDASHPNRSAWVWLAIGAIAVVATVFGFLHAGRSFWHLSSIEASYSQQQA